MKLYELTYLISPDLLEEETKILQEKIHNLVKEQGALSKEYSFKDPSRIELSYPINKKSHAYLTSINFSSTPEKMESLGKLLKGEDQILRYLIINKKEVSRSAPRRSAPKKESFTESPIKKPKKVELKDIEKKLEEILEE